MMNSFKIKKCIANTNNHTLSKCFKVGKVCSINKLFSCKTVYLEVY